MRRPACIALLCTLLSVAEAFVGTTSGIIVPKLAITSRHLATSSSSDGTHPPSEDESLDRLHSLVDRRRWLTSQVIASSAILVGGGNSAHAEEGSDGSSAARRRVVPRNKSVVVLGANGGTGRECVSAILATGRPCVATSRSGVFSFDEDDMSGGDGSSSLRRSNPNLQEGRADVTSLDSLLSLVDGIGSDKIGAMIFAASASVKGKTLGVNDAYTVDCQGVINAAQCCLQRNIPRLVIVSSGAVTRPNSSVYKLLNLVGGGIMEAKIRGEDGARALYRDEAAMAKGLGYTVVRPGGLTTGPSLGPAFLEVNQGDDKSGRLSRADVAGICAACLESEAAFDATLECYELNTAKPVDNVGLSNILRSTDATSYTSGREGRGETWEALLGGLKSDFAMT